MKIRFVGFVKVSEWNSILWFLFSHDCIITTSADGIFYSWRSKCGVHTLSSHIRPNAVDVYHLIISRDLWTTYFQRLEHNENVSTFKSIGFFWSVSILRWTNDLIFRVKYHVCVASIFTYCVSMIVSVSEFITTMATSMSNFTRMGSSAYLDISASA